MYFPSAGFHIPPDASECLPDPPYPPGWKAAADDGGNHGAFSWSAAYNPVVCGTDAPAFQGAGCALSAWNVP